MRLTDCLYAKRGFIRLAAWVRPDWSRANANQLTEIAPASVDFQLRKRCFRPHISRRSGNSMSETCLPQHRWAILVMAQLAIFMSTFEMSVVSLALPVIQSEFGVPLTQVKWVAVIYSGAAAMALPIAAYLGRLMHALVPLLDASARPDPLEWILIAGSLLLVGLWLRHEFSEGGSFLNLHLLKTAPLSFNFGNAILVRTGMGAVNFIIPADLGSLRAILHRRRLGLFQWGRGLQQYSRRRKGALGAFPDCSRSI